MKRFSFSVLLILSVFHFSLYSVENFTENTSENLNNNNIIETEKLNILNNINAEFSKVLSGEAICTPVNLSSGTALITDARNFTCLNDNGKTLWEHKLRFSSNSNLYSLKDDFILVTTKNNSVISVYNSSGLLIFQKELNESIKGKPIQGFDSRIFIPLKNKILCISITGIKKWELELNYEGNIFLLNDGTIVVNNESDLINISPFGDILDSKQIENKFTKIFQAKHGIILFFSDSSIGFYSKTKSTMNQEKNADLKIHENWNFKSENNEDKLIENFIYSKTSDISVFYTDNGKFLKFYYVDEISGKITNAITLESDKKTFPYNMYLNQSGLLLINQKTAEFYDNYGTIIWKKNLSESEEEKPLFTILKDDNTLILFCKNWSINFYTIVKNNSITKKEQSLNPRNNNLFLENYYSNSQVLFSGNFKSQVKSFLKGDFENNEKFYISTLLDFYKKYTSTLTSSEFGIINQPTQFEQDISSNLQLINLSFTMQCDEFSDYIIEIIRNDNNPAVLKAVLSGLSKYGYDPDYRILNEISIRAKKIPPHEEQLIPYICEATGAICKFMGKKAFELYGNQIIRTFFSEQFSPDAKKIARDTYLKISKSFQYN